MLKDIRSKIEELAHARGVLKRREEALDTEIAEALPEALREGLLRVSGAYEGIEGGIYITEAVGRAKHRQCDPALIAYKALGAHKPGTPFYDDVLRPLKELSLIGLWYSSRTGEDTDIEFPDLGRGVALVLRYMVIASEG